MLQGAPATQQQMGALRAQVEGLQAQLKAAQEALAATQAEVCETFTTYNLHKKNLEMMELHSLLCDAVNISLGPHRRHAGRGVHFRACVTCCARRHKACNVEDSRMHNALRPP